MNTKIFKKAAAGAVFAFALVICTAAMAQTAATLGDVRGDVRVRSSSDAQWKTAAGGEKLAQGASIRTGTDGQAVLRWGQDNAVKVFPLSNVGITELLAKGNVGRTKFALQNGRLLAKASKLKTHDSTFEIRTPTAIAAVRGTAFDVSMSPQADRTSIAVVEGSLYVSAGDEVLIVSAGFETVAEKDAAPSRPAPIPPAQLLKLKEEAVSIGAAIGAVPGEKKHEKAEAVKNMPSEKAAETAVETAVDVGEVSDDIVIDNLDDAYDEVAVQDTILDEAHTDIPCEDGGCISGTIEF